MPKQPPQSSAPTTVDVIKQRLHAWMAESSREAELITIIHVLLEERTQDSALLDKLESMCPFSLMGNWVHRDGFYNSFSWKKNGYGWNSIKRRTLRELLVAVSNAKYGENNY